MPALTDFLTAAAVREKWGYCKEGELDAWIAEQYPHKLTCYDLNACVRKWLEHNRAERDKLKVELAALRRERDSFKASQ